LEFREADWWPATGPAAWTAWPNARLDYLKDRWPETLNGMGVLDVVCEEPPWSA
jgi:hypothetical protein